MTAVTIDLTTLLAATVSISAGAVAFAWKHARDQTVLKERVNWLCTRYASDHDTAVPWEEPITDGGRPVADGGLPADDEPDGDALAPHHFWVGLAVAGFGFGSVWKYYPVTGAVMTGIGLLVAADDAIEHIFGVPTPLDMLWKRVIHPAVRRVEDD